MLLCFFLISSHSLCLSSCVTSRYSKISSVILSFLKHLSSSKRGKNSGCVGILNSSSGGMWCWWLLLPHFLGTNLIHFLTCILPCFFTSWQIIFICIYYTLYVYYTPCSSELFDSLKTFLSTSSGAFQVIITELYLSLQSSVSSCAHFLLSYAYSHVIHIIAWR